jgi:bisphosphoglycerate-dependent phosphoglycerate mutase
VITYYCFLRNLIAMKKSFLIFFALVFTQILRGQTTTLESANKPLSFSQKATLEWVRTYDLTPEQAQKASVFQENKYKALSKMEVLRSKDLKKYIAKRQSAYTVAENELMTILDERQMEVFKTQQAEKKRTVTSIVSAMKKSGKSDNDIEKKLADMDF